MRIDLSSFTCLALTCLSLAACELGDESVADDDQDLPGTIALPGVTGKLTLYDATELRGNDPYDTSVTDRHLSDNGDTPRHFNDKASSIINKTPRYWTLFRNANLETDSGLSGDTNYICIKPWSYILDLRTIALDRGWPQSDLDWNNRISSVEKGSSVACPSGGKRYGREFGE